MVFDDAARLRALADYRVLDTVPEEAFDEITRLAATILRTPIALVSLVDEDRQWFKSRVGLEAIETPREYAFCDHAIRADVTMVVEDATKDPRFADNPLVTSAPFVRFYCGVPLHSPEGHGLGTLCVLDSTPRTISAADRAVLESLAHLVETALEVRRRLVSLQGAMGAQRERQHSKELLAAMLVHDLRGPLTVITLIAAGLEPANPECRPELDDLQSEAARASRMLTDVLDICLYGMGQLKLRCVAVRASRLVEEVVRRMASRARSRGQSVSLALPSESVILDADPELIGRVVENLLANAMHHGPAGQPITVAIRATEDAHLRLEVRDRGEPLSVELRGSVFAAFETRSADESAAQQRNFGLGLTFCQLAVTAHDGRIGVEPGVDGGNCFFVELPLKRRA
ncbi:MAG TPA: ATP-binding protein [Labilithrix sp.]|nr:ATP-binding protein [Labilithrix sp.]